MTNVAPESVFSSMEGHEDNPNSLSDDENTNEQQQQQQQQSVTKTATPKKKDTKKKQAKSMYIYYYVINFEILQCCKVYFLNIIHVYAITSNQ